MRLFLLSIAQKIIPAISRTTAISGMRGTSGRQTLANFQQALLETPAIALDCMVQRPDQGKQKLPAATPVPPASASNEAEGEDGEGVHDGGCMVFSASQVVVIQSVETETTETETTDKTQTRNGRVTVVEQSQYSR